MNQANPTQSPHPNPNKQKPQTQHLKQSKIYIGDQCCSKHYACIQNVHNSKHQNKDDSFSFNSQLLVEYQPMQISAEPLIQIVVKPEVQMLTMMNLKKKKYEKILEECQIGLLQENKKKNLQKLQEQIKTALQRSKKQKIEPKNKWNHSIFNQNMAHDLQTQQKRLVKTGVVQMPRKQQQKKKVELKPIYQRIAQYKSLQKNRNKQDVECQYRKKEVKPETEEQIESNAKKILETMRLQKLKKEEERKIIQAKIRALQIKSRMRVQKCTKKQFQGGEDFDLGDSQYSTFEARAQNRKITKKQKKPKVKPKTDQNNQNDSNKYGPKNFLRRTSTSLLKPKKDIQNTKTQLNIANSIEIQNTQKQQQQSKQQSKGPFFIWNIPIKPQDLKTLQSNIGKSEYLNVDRFNYKSGKTFRQEANEYLAQRMQKKMMNHNEQIKRKTFLDHVSIKKQRYLDEFRRQEVAGQFKQAFWNEDEVFKPNILENFHFYAQTNSSS